MFSSERIHFIEKSLELNHVFVDSCSDFTPEETEGLIFEFNIRFKNSSSGCFCYFSSKPGAGGFGKTYIEAFCYMLRRLDYKRNPELPLFEDLLQFFQQLK